MTRAGTSMQVYLAGPITHAVDSVSWREMLSVILRYKYGIVAVLPMAGADYAQFGAREEDTASILTLRDKWMTTKSDAVLANFTGSKKASIGTCIELGWANEAGVPIIAVIPEGNIHNHPMVDSIIDFKVETLEDALGVLRGLNGKL